MPDQDVPIELGGRGRLRYDKERRTIVAEHPAYHLTFQFKSNERPWSGSHQARGITDDAAAIRWAEYFVDKIGSDYQITLYKNGVPLPLPEHVAYSSAAGD